MNLSQILIQISGSADAIVARDGPDGGVVVHHGANESVTRVIDETLVL